MSEDALSMLMQEAQVGAAFRRAARSLKNTRAVMPQEAISGLAEIAEMVERLSVIENEILTYLRRRPAPGQLSLLGEDHSE